jgi:gamma-glutamylcyclotransferase (GGCT)/AIG2-like uncharacterized protein YtfP
MEKANSKEPTGALYAVYGTLRKGYGNHNRLLNNKYCEYLGTTKTKPEFKMVSLGGFPGVIPGGKQEVVIEVYRVNSPQVEQQLNWLEGHRGKGNPNNFYDITEIETHWGIANMYTLTEEEYGTKNIIKSGDWSSYIKERH